MKEKLKEIVSQLVESTLNGSITWEKKNSIFASEKCHPFRVLINKDTWFDIELLLSDTMQMTGTSSLWMYNKDLVEGRKLLSNSEYMDIKKIETFLYNNMIKQNIVYRRPVEDILDDILNDIPDKQNSRDKKISEIIGEDN